MPNVQRMTDANGGGGVIQTIPQSFVRVDGLLCAVVQSRGSAHAPCPEVPIHCQGAWQTVATQTAVRINGMAVVRTQDVDTCGHARVGGSTTTRIGGGAAGGPNDWDSGTGT